MARRYFQECSRAHITARDLEPGAQLRFYWTCYPARDAPRKDLWDSKRSERASYVLWNCVATISVTVRRTRKRSLAETTCRNNRMELYRSLQTAAAHQRYLQPANASANWQIYVNDFESGYKQSIVGFGAAFTDAAVTSFNWLSESDQMKLARELFTLDGDVIGINLVRHTIGQSDLTPASIGKWSYESLIPPM